MQKGGGVQSFNRAEMRIKNDRRQTCLANGCLSRSRMQQRRDLAEMGRFSDFCLQLKYAPLLPLLVLHLDGFVQ